MQGAGTAVVVQVSCRVGCDHLSDLEYVGELLLQHNQHSPQFDTVTSDLGFLTDTSVPREFADCVRCRVLRSKRR
jgi:hypothetical protein